MEASQAPPPVMVDAAWPDHPRDLASVMFAQSVLKRFENDLTTTSAEPSLDEINAHYASHPLNDSHRELTSDEAAQLWSDLMAGKQGAVVLSDLKSEALRQVRVYIRKGLDALRESQNSQSLKRERSEAAEGEEASHKKRRVESAESEQDAEASKPPDQPVVSGDESQQPASAQNTPTEPPNRQGSPDQEDKPEGESAQPTDTSSGAAAADADAASEKAGSTPLNDAPGSAPEAASEPEAAAQRETESPAIPATTTSDAPAESAADTAPDDTAEPASESDSVAASVPESDTESLKPPTAEALSDEPSDEPVETSSTHNTEPEASKQEPKAAASAPADFDTNESDSSGNQDADIPDSETGDGIPLSHPSQDEAQDERDRELQANEDTGKTDEGLHSVEDSAESSESSRQASAAPDDVQTPDSVKSGTPGAGVQELPQAASTKEEDQPENDVADTPRARRRSRASRASRSARSTPQSSRAASVEAASPAERVSSDAAEAKEIPESSRGQKRRASAVTEKEPSPSVDESLLTLVNALRSSPALEPFQTAPAENSPAVLSPTDLSTIYSQIENGELRSIDEVEQELAKMLANAVVGSRMDVAAAAAAIDAEVATYNKAVTSKPAQAAAQAQSQPISSNKRKR